MINSSAKSKVLSLWNDYQKSSEPITTLKGKEILEIDKKRILAIEDIKKIIASFLNGETDVFSFKTSLDSYNKRNNLWGFTAVKGQMFFNQLVRTYGDDGQKFPNLLKEVIREPKDLNEALNFIEKLETYISDDYDKASDKRKVPKPSSVGYFLSYFWQIHNYKKWPILYSSLISTFSEIGIWEEKENQKETYRFFYHLNEDIKAFLSSKTNSKIGNWGVEHCFWSLHLNNRAPEPKTKPKIESEPVNIEEESKVTLAKPNFDIQDYLIPLLSNLVELGEDHENTSSKKGHLFEKKVAQAFNQLDFDVVELGQGRGRNPDAILKFRKENIAFIVDAKAYSKGYDLGIDDRAIREYINVHCPKLQDDGFKKIGFIIVSNSFKSDFETFINDVTWNTPIKRFILITTNALLHLVAYKAKDKLDINQITESLIKLGTLITEKEVIGEFEDV